VHLALHYKQVNTCHTQNIISMNCAYSNYPLIFKSKRGILDITFILEEPNKLNTLIQSHINYSTTWALNLSTSKHTRIKKIIHHTTEYPSKYAFTTVHKNYSLFIYHIHKFVKL